MPSHNTWRASLLGVFLVIWVALAIGPNDREAWMLENALSTIFVIALLVLAKPLPLSRISYGLIFVFLCLHSVGAHYTYAQVPYNAWTEALFGTPFNDWVGWERNHYDRLVHFSYGLLLAYPIREVFCRVASARGFWGYFLPVDLTMSTSMIFELIEWAAAEVFGGDLGQAYLGTQGDIWDAHKDMLLASIGAMIGMSITAFLNFRLQRDFNREFLASLTVKDTRPAGEDEILRMMNGEE